MFKKIELWILYLTIFLGLIFTIGFGFLVRQELVGSTKLGWASKLHYFYPKFHPMQFKLFSQNKTYVEDRHKNLKQGFNIYQSNEINGPKYLLLSRWDADSNDGIVELVDIHEFKVLHVWNPNISEFYKNFDSKNKLLDDLSFSIPESRFQTFSPVLANGILYFHGNQTPILGLDSDSNVVKVFDDYFHHSLELTYDNFLWTTNVSCPISNKIIKDNDCESIRDENIIKLDLEGNVVYEKNITDLLHEHDINVFKNHDVNIDITHVNDVQPINVASKYWNRETDVFISLRSLDFVFLYDTENNSIKWITSLLSGLKNQHDVNVVSNEEISIFNNNILYEIKDGKKSRTVDGYSNMITYNFNDSSYDFIHEESFKEYQIKTLSSGRGEITKTGNMLIEESNYGRLVYLDPQGNKIWEYYNKANNGKVGRVTWHNLITEDYEIIQVEKF